MQILLARGVRVQFGQWLKRNGVEIVILAIALVSSILGSGLGRVIVNSDVALQSIIQAESTILGFFGVVVAYLLASYDTRLDRLEQQCFDLEATDPINQQFHKERANAIHRKIKRVESIKRRLAVVIVITSIFLILSLLLSVAVLSMNDSDIFLAELLSPYAVVAFFTGIFGFVILFSTTFKKVE
jgi:hypothetical protein